MCIYRLPFDGLVIIYLKAVVLLVNIQVTITGIHVYTCSLINFIFSLSLSLSLVSLSLVFLPISLSPYLSLLLPLSKTIVATLVIFL